MQMFHDRTSLAFPGKIRQLETVFLFQGSYSQKGNEPARPWEQASIRAIKRRSLCGEHSKEVPQY